MILFAHFVSTMNNFIFFTFKKYPDYAGTF